MPRGRKKINESVDAVNPAVPLRESVDIAKKKPAPVQAKKNTPGIRGTPSKKTDQKISVPDDFIKPDNDPQESRSTSASASTGDSDSTSYETDTSASESDTDDGSFDNVEIDDGISLVIPKSYLENEKKAQRFEEYLKSLDKKLDKYCAAQSAAASESTILHSKMLTSSTKPAKKTVSSIKELTAKKTRGPDKKPRAPRGTLRHNNAESKESKAVSVEPDNNIVAAPAPVVAQPVRKALVRKSELKL